ncbi:MAG: hypothetical protein WCY29_07090 [Novosphingobium sp.]
MNAPDHVPPPDEERARIIRGRNRVFALLLGGFAILVFAISIAKMS